jgi:hypothetical protein
MEHLQILAQLDLLGQLDRLALGPLDQLEQNQLLLDQPVLLVKQDKLVLLEEMASMEATATPVQLDIPVRLVQKVHQALFRDQRDHKVMLA